jgi:hypothetical protein
MVTTHHKGEVLSGARPGVCFDTFAVYRSHCPVPARPRQRERRANTRCTLLSAGGLTTIDVLGVQVRLGSEHVPRLSNLFHLGEGDFSTRSLGDPTSCSGSSSTSRSARGPDQFGVSLVNPVGDNPELSLDEVIRALGFVGFELSHMNGVEDGRTRVHEWFYAVVLSSCVRDWWGARLLGIDAQRRRSRSSLIMGEFLCLSFAPVWVKCVGIVLSFTTNANNRVRPADVIVL